MTPRLVTLAQLLAGTEYLNDSQPLFDADSLEVEAGPTPQQVVIHGGKHTSAIRKLVDRLNPQHAEIDATPDPDAPKPAKTTTPAGSDYPLPSAQVLASIIPPDESFPKGHVSGLAPGSTLERHTHTSTPGATTARASSATRISSDSTATYTATAHSDTPAAATSTTPDSAVTKTHEGQLSSGIHPGEGAPRAATAAKREAAEQEAEKTVSGKPESKTTPKPSELSGAQPHDPSTGQPARAKPDAKPAVKPRSRSRNATSTAKKKT